MNYLERLTIEIESRKSQLKTLKLKNADYACKEIELEIQLLKKELHRYMDYETTKVHHIYIKNEN